MLHYVYLFLALIGSVSALGRGARIARQHEALWVRMWGTHIGAKIKNGENNQLHVQF